MLGLTTGIIICLLVVYAFGFDKFHANYKSIHLLEMNQNFAGTIYTGSWTPAPLGPVLQKEVPGLKYVARAREEGQSLTAYGEKAIYQEGMYAEPDFFRMMTFPAIEGDPVATLQVGSGVVLTESAAVFAVMAILISCLGLFGLASFLVERRTREISIRKVLGASPAGLWLSLSTEMLKPVVLGVIVATPLAAMAMAGLLSLNDYHIRLSWWFFALAGAGAILIALATVSWHGVRAGRINPARNLQTE